jgi:hypothetical protein
MFAGVTDTVTVNDPIVGEQVVTIQKLSWKTLEKASDIQTERGLAHTVKLGANMAQVIQDRLDAQAKTDLTPEEQLEQKRQARYRNYDRDHIVRAGVKSWTAPPKLPAALETLDEETADILYRAIIDLSLPPLDPAVAEAERKNA